MPNKTFLIVAMALVGLFGLIACAPSDDNDVMAAKIVAGAEGAASLAVDDLLVGSDGFVGSAIGITLSNEVVARLNVSNALSAGHYAAKRVVLQTAAIAHQNMQKPDRAVVEKEAHEAASLAVEKWFKGRITPSGSKAVVNASVQKLIKRFPQDLPNSISLRATLYPVVTPLMQVAATHAKQSILKDVDGAFPGYWAGSFPGDD